jgi:hypothetical protein
MLQLIEFLQNGAQLQAASAISDAVFEGKIGSLPAESHIALGPRDKGCKREKEERI